MNDRPATAGLKPAGFLVLALACLASPATGQPAPDKVIYCPKVDAAIAVDGRLDEPAWRSAGYAYLARAGGLSPLLPTQMRVLWDSTHLYLGFAMFDNDLRATLDERDTMVWRDGDCIEFFLAPEAGQVLRYELQVNPTGALMDLAYQADQPFDESIAWQWPGIAWATHVEGTLNDDRADAWWSVELALPWAAIVGHGGQAPADGASYRVLSFGINRATLADGRLSRESSSWPVQDREVTTDINQYGWLQLVGADPPNMPIEGFADIIESAPSTGDALRLSYRGAAPYWTLATGHRLRWRTAAVPERSDKTVTFAFSAATLGRKGYVADWYTLHLNDRQVLRFDPHRPASHTWTGDGVELAFHHRYGSALSTGIFELTVPADWAPAGQPSVLEVRHATDSPATSFLVEQWPDTARFHFHQTAAGR